MPRDIARDIMLLLAQRWERIQAYKRHGKDGAPISGKLYDVAAAYLLDCPESTSWRVDDEVIPHRKLSNYIKNALDTGKKYARQELYTSGAEPVTPKRAYDWWDITEVKQMFKTSEQAKQEFRQTDFEVEEVESIVSIEEPAEVPVIAMSVSTGDTAEAHEQAVGAEVMAQRRTSLGKTVQELKSATLPLMSELASRMSCRSAAEEPEHMRIMRAFKFVYEHDRTYKGQRLCAVIVQNNKRGKAAVLAINALCELHEADHAILKFVYDYLCEDL